MSKNIAIILAGGKGLRVGSELPKQFLKIAGKKVIEHTIEVFEKHEDIHEIAIVSNNDYIRDMEQLLIKNEYRKVKKILSGGKERYDSSLAAIKAYDGEDVNLLFHDAVRPLLRPRIISDCILALKDYKAVDVAIKTTDTIIAVEKNRIRHIPDRNNLYNGQTPQAFSLATIKKAYELALKDPDFKVTDDCGVVKKYLPKEDIFVVEGAGDNMKLTYREDIFLLDKLFQLRSIGSHQNALTAENKLHLKNKILVVFGGSRGIGKNMAVLAEEQGAKVYCFSRSTTATDVSKLNEVKEALEKVYRTENKIDFVINTAGVLSRQPLHSMDEETIAKSIQINYLGAVYVAKEAFPYLNKTKGSLLLFTSSSYTRGRSLYSLYSSAKAALVNLTQALAEEWEDVKVNCINPERTKTPMRIQNFGNEPEHTLLKSEQVAVAALNTLFSPFSGQVIDVKK